MPLTVNNAFVFHAKPIGLLYDIVSFLVLKWWNELSIDNRTAERLHIFRRRLKKPTCFDCTLAKKRNDLFCTWHLQRFSLPEANAVVWLTDSVQYVPAVCSHLVSSWLNAYCNSLWIKVSVK